MMNVNVKFFVVALVLSLIFSVGAVCAHEDMSFEQSNAVEVPVGTADVNPDINQENNDDSVSSNNIVGAGNDNFIVKTNHTVSGSSFQDIRDAIDNADAGDTIYLMGGNYTGDGSQINIDKKLTIVGGFQSGDGKYATLDGKKLSSILHINAREVTIQGIKFINGNSSSVGGAVSWNGDNGNLTDCIFENNSADLDGGAVYFRECAEGKIINCNFTDNSAKNGGAIYFNNTVNNATVIAYFKGNTAERAGGAIYVRGKLSNTNFSSQFYDNKAMMASGGAMFFMSLAENNTFKNSFMNNYALYGGGIFFYNRANNNKFNSNFTSNIAKSCGGAIFFYSTTDNNNFTGYYTNNRALGQVSDTVGNGGAITFKDVSTNCILTCEFINNTAALYGGGVNYRQTPHNITFNGNFIGNNASTGGGVNFFESFENVIFNVEFIGNSAVNGGALATGNGSVREVSFRNNHAQNGGAIWMSSGNVTNCSFTNNSAFRGSALYIAGCTNISDSGIFNNLANSTSLELSIDLTDNNLIVKSVLTGEDNLLNGIYAESNEVYLRNVTYLGFNGVMNTGDDWITPVGSADLSENGTLVYMDSREAGQNITVEIYKNGHLYEEHTLTSDIYGEVSVAFTDLKPGNYTVKSYLKKNSYYTPIEDSDSLSIPKIDDYTMDINSTNSFVGDIANVTVVLPSDATGNVTVMDADGNNYTCPVDNGMAVVEVPGLPLGDNNVNVTYSGDDQYVGRTVSHTVHVDLMPTLLTADILEKYQGDDGRFAVVLSDVNGNPVSGMSVKINMVGKVYNCTTNASGVATLPINLKVGIYPVTVEFEGKGNYSNATPVSSEVHILTKVRIDKNKNLVKDYGDADKFTVRLLDEYGKPVAGEVVNMTVAGKTYHCKSNADGYASLAINLKPGTYDIVCEYAGYKVTNKITVKQVLSAYNRQYKKASSYLFTATLKHSGGKVISGKTVTFSFKGKTYTQKTNGNGEATITIKEALNIAKYNIYIRYLDSTITRTISIK